MDVDLPEGPGSEQPGLDLGILGGTSLHPPFRRVAMGKMLRRLRGWGVSCLTAETRWWLPGRNSRVFRHCGNLVSPTMVRSLIPTSRSRHMYTDCTSHSLPKGLEDDRRWRLPSDRHDTPGFGLKIATCYIDGPQDSTCLSFCDLQSVIDGESHVNTA